MRSSIQGWARLGIVHSMAFPHAVESTEAYLSTVTEILKDPFFEVVELGNPPFAELIEMVPPLVDQAACTLTYCGHGLLFGSGANINSLDETERARAVAILKEGIDEAYAMGSEEFQFLSRHWEEGKEDAYLDALIRSTKELCAYAASKGDMPVVLEVFDHNIDKKSLLGPAVLVARYAEAVRAEWENFGIMIDCSHIPIIGESIDEAVDPIVQYITHVHIGNAFLSDPEHPSYGDYHPRFEYPGGENDTAYLAAFLQKLVDIGYLSEGGRKILSFEVKPQEGEDSSMVVAGSKRILERAWRMVT
ncbi:MAG TPA: TIM barrel protein [Sphaerochaeta sp.]|nr:TIM barrel protein [Sphaerochaeta sp.]